MTVIKINKDLSSGKVNIENKSSVKDEKEGDVFASQISPSVNTTALTRKHFSRLRQYWRQGTYNGRPLTGTGDNVDLDLVGFGLIERVRDNQWLSSQGYFRITAKGEKVLHTEKGAEISRRSPHHELGGRLAEYLQEQGRVTWENVQFEVEYMENGQMVFAKSRPDVFSMKATYNKENMKPVVHEVKVRRADFLVDRANERKRKNYKLIAERFFYVCPQGLILPEEVPEDCGLMYETAPRVFRVIKHSKKFNGVLKEKDWMSLVLKGGKTKNPHEQ